MLRLACPRLSRAAAAAARSRGTAEWRCAAPKRSGPHPPGRRGHQGRRPRIAGARRADDWAVLDAVDAVGSLALIFVAGYALARRGVWAKRRLLWRVRRKLILSYIFVGLVPGLLIIAFFLLAGLAAVLQRQLVPRAVARAHARRSGAVSGADGGPRSRARRPPSVLPRRLDSGQRDAAERFPFTSMAIVPVKGLECAAARATAEAAAPARRRCASAPGSISIRPRRCRPGSGATASPGLVAYEAPTATGPNDRLVMRAVALPEVPAHRSGPSVVDLPFTLAIEQRLRDETGIQLGEITRCRSTSRPHADAARRALEPRAATPATTRPAFGEGWVAFLDVHDWDTGATGSATVAHAAEPAARSTIGISTISAGRSFGQVLLLCLAFIGVLFLIIQFVALVIGFVLARQITGAVHDLFTGTEHLRNRDFTHQIPVRARDQLGELADSFNVMTGEITAPARERREGADGAGDARRARDSAEAAAVGPAERARGLRRRRSANRPARSPATTTTSCTVSTPSSACSSPTCPARACRRASTWRS